MPRGSKDAYTDKQKRMAAHIEEGYESRGTCQIVFPDDVPSGATAWVAAAWLSTRGRSGRACLPVRVTIQGGPVLAAG